MFPLAPRELLKFQSFRHQYKSKTMEVCKTQSCKIPLRMILLLLLVSKGNEKCIGFTMGFSRIFFFFFGLIREDPKKVSCFTKKHKKR